MTDYRSLYLKTKKTVADKDMFTNMVTHELRAPLTAIRGYASMLMETDPEKVELKRIRQSAERSLGIVNDLLDVARLQSGKLKISMAPCNLSEVVAFVLSELEVTAHDKQITLSKSISSSIQVLADEKRLQQVFINLVTNAIKYTQAGSIVIEAKGVNDDVEVRIKDTGSGIDSADQKRLFAPFFRVKSKSVNATTGTGLGMLITKQLIEHMNGTIAVESIKGVGTNIVITLSTAPETQTK